MFGDFKITKAIESVGDETGTKNSGVAATQQTAAAGGGKFELSDVTLGVFAEDQPTHRISLGGDTMHDRPLQVDQGWILPAGAAGICEFDQPLTFSTVSIPASLLEEVGYTRAANFEAKIGAHDPLLLQMIRTIEQFDKNTPQIYKETIHRAIAAHLSQILEPTGPDEIVLIGDKRLSQAIDYIHDNIGVNLSLEDLAAQATMSPYHFARAFRKATGFSPLQFVIKERLQFARVLLSTTKLTVADIAQRCGYEDVSRFRKQFKRQFSITPAQTRK